jgi:hypothetical protein
LGTIVAPPGASPEAAAIEAGYVVLSTYFPASGATLYADRTASLAAIPDGQSKIDGIATGDTAAEKGLTGCLGDVFRGRFPNMP